jgi:plastocyanin
VTVLSPFLRRLNMGTLALVMCIALAVISSIRGKESTIREFAPERAKKTEVVIANFNFSPRSVTVPIGAIVTWTNHDSVPHTVTSADNRFKKSPVLKPGQSFSNTFAMAGSFSYFCSVHPRMTGQIIVK